jgi:hypothetical protein
MARRHGDSESANVAWQSATYMRAAWSAGPHSPLLFGSSGAHTESSKGSQSTRAVLCRRTLHCAASRLGLAGKCVPPLRHCKQRHAAPACSPCHERAAHVPHMQQRAQWQAAPASEPGDGLNPVHRALRSCCALHPRMPSSPCPRPQLPLRRKSPKPSAAHAAGPAVQQPPHAQ